MNKIVVPTKFNKTGKRVLTTPLAKKRVTAPACQQYRQTIGEAETEWRRKWDSAKKVYVESMASWIASYVARDSTPVAEKCRIVKFLAERSLAAEGVMNIEGPGSFRRWSNQLGGIPELSRVEEAAWEDYHEAFRKADAEKAAVCDKASKDCDDMERALWREVLDHLHHLARGLAEN